MSSDAIYFFSTFPSIIFRLFTEIKIPGLGFTPATLLFGILSFYVSIFVIKNVLDIGIFSAAQSINSSDKGSKK